MRVLQLIDTLSPGGAEKMAVNFANKLSEKIVFSGLVATRFDGDLRDDINVNISYECLHKKHALDLKALFKLKRYVTTNQVQIVHAHGTTFFTAFLLKCVCSKIKIIYHEHFGGRANETFSQNLFLIFCSLFFTEIIVVNPDLKQWCDKFLLCKNVSFLPNFSSLSNDEIATTTLKGANGKRMLMLANLKSPKNHLFVLKTFYESNLFLESWTLHLVGKIFYDHYYADLHEFVSKVQLQNAIFFYDSRQDIKNILSQSTIGILASTSEGFPVSILEYAQMKLPVISTNVGYCASVIKNNQTGFLFNPLDQQDFQTQLNLCVADKDLRSKLAENLHQNCEDNYSENAVILQLISIYSKNQ